jgi:hypothetical protein
MKFLMITSWENHWDKLQQFNYSTLFRKRHIFWPLTGRLPEGPVETIFKKVNGLGECEGIWKGTTSNFREVIYKNEPAIRFEVSNLSIHQDASTNRLSIGWYALNDAVPEGEKPYSSLRQKLEPPFFDTLLHTKSWQEFEQYAFYLIKSLGIHDILSVPQHSNRGQADGSFLCANKLAVIYDATLESDLSKKDKQIENYIAQLRRDILIHDRRHFTINGIDKQVWIVVQDGKRCQLLFERDGIKVKQVPVRALMKLYYKRLTTIGFNQDDLWDALKDLTY